MLVSCKFYCCFVGKSGKYHIPQVKSANLT
jgi:hypothetical protein